MNHLEQRFLRTEIRAISEPDDDDGDEFALDGYASVFNQESGDDTGADFREIVAPTAFTRSLAEKRNVRALFNHNPDRVLGTVASKTLALSTDNRGLHFRVKLDRQNPDHVSVFRMVKTGRVSECSFGFVCKKDSWADVRGADGTLYQQRTLHDVDLLDVSAVTYPFYSGLGADVAARSAMLFPQGIPQEIRSRVPRLAALVDRTAHAAQRMNALLLS